LTEDGPQGDAIIFIMCGRYRLSRRKQILEEHFHAQPDDDQEWTAHYNIAPAPTRFRVKANSHKIESGKSAPTSTAENSCYSAGVSAMRLVACFHLMQFR
jgi:hypothetical protein